MKPEDKLKQLRETYEEFKEQNDQRIASEKLYKKKLAEEFDCDSLEEAKAERKKITDKINRKEKELTDEIDVIENDMIKAGILNEED
jgi:hypothetical protein